MHDFSVTDDPSWGNRQIRATRWRGIGLGFQMWSGLQLGLVSLPLWSIADQLSAIDERPWWFKLLCSGVSGLALLNLLLPILVWTRGQLMAVSLGLIRVTVALWLLVMALSNHVMILQILPAGLSMIALLMHRRLASASSMTISHQDDWASRMKQ